MAQKLQSDRWMFIATIALVLISVVMVYSASAVMADVRFQQSTAFSSKQLMWALLGCVFMVGMMHVDYRRYRNDRLMWTLLGLVVVMLVAVLFSRPINGARRWFGLAGFGIQPSEVAKLAAILFAAIMLERRADRINDIPQTLLPIIAVVGTLAGLIVIEPDFGTSVAIVAVVGCMVFAAGLSWRYMGTILLVGVPAAFVVLMQADYRRRRLTTFLDPWTDPRGDGFQIIQSLQAVGTGGVTGKGLMQSTQKFFYLPDPHTDFIFAVISEETGLVGAVIVLACFCVLAWRGLRLSARIQDPFGSYLALGLTLMLVLQAFVNMSVVLGLAPTKGIPLPLVSAGGSSLLINLVGVGVLLNISQHVSQGRKST
ncbi:MAG: putative lipid II flippase FtsW [Acidobacteria bacterium]|nr:putative lipid II flippase FtsW [Acidobacteriota bacterium]